MRNPKKAGRPLGSVKPNSKHVQVAARLPDDLAAWVKSRPEGVTAAIIAGLKLLREKDEG